jgi:hypothetical protein
VQALTDGFSLGFATAVGFAVVAAVVAILAPGRSTGGAALPAQRTEEPAAPGTAPAVVGAPAAHPTRQENAHD